jgi:hypothetical protein
MPGHPAAASSFTAEMQVFSQKKIDFKTFSQPQLSGMSFEFLRPIFTRVCLRRTLLKLFLLCYCSRVAPQWGK